MSLTDAANRAGSATAQGHADRFLAWGKRFASPLATSAVPFLLIAYLALRGGGYDSIVRGEVGIGVWWIVLLGAIVGLLPIVRISAVGWGAIGLLGALLVWTTLGIAWSESSERTVLEVARVSTHLGVLVLALAVQGRDGLRRTVIAVGAALALIGLLALLSRLQPAWFPANETGTVLEFAQARLNYPVDYWNGLAALMAIGAPLVLVAAVQSRSLLAQALATAAIPVLALTSYYTLSRGGVLEMSVALIAFFALYPRRLAAAPTAGLALAGSGLLIAAATQRNALEDGLTTSAALEQGDEMLAITMIVCVGVALARTGLGLALRHGLGPRWGASRRTTLLSGAAVASIAAVGLLASGGPGQLGDAWEEFKSPAAPAADDTSGRFESASGNGRYQYWQGAVDANATAPLLGIGPGTYEFYWARDGTLPGFIRDAHSLYFETFAELGIVGLVLVLAPILALLWFGGRRSLRGSPGSRPWLAAATAACATFAVAAAVDWVWELAVLPVVFLCLAGALLNHRGRERATSAGDHQWRSRAGLAVLAVPAVVAIGIPLLAYKAVAASEEGFHAEQLAAALESARDAAALEPWAASPPTWEALVLERQGELGAAAQAAAEATREEPTNWRTWWIRTRIEESRGDSEASARAYRRARALNPRSSRFGG